MLRVKSLNVQRLTLNAQLLTLKFPATLPQGPFRFMILADGLAAGMHMEFLIDAPLSYCTIWMR
jgi:hypothetical protein